MRKIDRKYAEEVLARLSALPPDAKPQWGSMTLSQMVGHVNLVVRYTLGEQSELPFKGNWRTRRIFGPLILNGIVKIPKNVRLPRPEGAKTPPPPPEGDLDTLRLSLDEYLKRAEAGGLPARPHPFFGMLTPRQWRRFHRVHTEHHLTQFGA